MLMTDNSILRRQEKKLHKIRKEKTFFHKSGVKEMLVLACVAFDACTIFPSIDLYFTQAAWISVIATVALAFCLDVPPMLLGTALADQSLSPQEKKPQVIGLIVAFGLTFLSTFALRFASMDEMFPVVSLQITGQTAAQAEVKHTAGHYIMQLIMGLLPLCTSITSFVLGVQASGDDDYRHQLRLNEIELRTQIDAMKVMQSELRQEMTFDLESYDMERYQIRLETIRDQSDILCSDARKLLSEQLGTADGVTELMEEPEQTRQEILSSGSATRLNLTA